MSDSTQLSTHITPYECAKLANQRLVAEGFATIPPQMMYNYTSAKVRAGKKALIEFDPELGVVRSAFEEWLERYVAKKVAK